MRFLTRPTPRESSLSLQTTNKFYFPVLPCPPERGDVQVAQIQKLLHRLSSYKKLVPPTLHLLAKDITRTPLLLLKQPFSFSEGVRSQRRHCKEANTFITYNLWSFSSPFCPMVPTTEALLWLKRENLSPHLLLRKRRGGRRQPSRKQVTAVSSKLYDLKIKNHKPYTTLLDRVSLCRGCLSSLILLLLCHSVPICSCLISATWGAGGEGG